MAEAGLGDRGGEICQEAIRVGVGGAVAVPEAFGVLKVLLCHGGGLGIQFILEAAALRHYGHVDGGCRVQLDGQPLAVSAGSFDAAPAPCAVSHVKQAAAGQLLQPVMTHLQL